MKKSLFTLVLALLVSAIFSTVWNVNSIPGMAAYFNNLDVACASSDVADYDTLYVYGAPFTYSDVTLTRPLTIIGPGYFLNQNPGLQNNLTPAKVANIMFDPGSSGSLVSGMTITYLQVNIPNIVVQRNYIGRMGIYDSNCIILQNFVNCEDWNGQSIYADMAANYLIANNFIAASAGECFHSTETCSGIFANNITNNSCLFYNADIYNCIFWFFGQGYDFGFSYNPATSFHHNVFRDISSWSWQPNASITGEGNLYDVTGEIYVATGSQDGYYQLCPGSPAIGAGISGQDCGIFGGLEPYRLSGIPAIPTIYEFTAPATGFVIPVQIKARSNN